MSLSRTLLLRASRSRWLAEQLRRRRFARRAVRRFMPGEDADAALDAAAELRAAGMGTVLTQLGERTTRREEAEAVREHYLGLLDALGRRGLSADLSVKPTHLGLDVDRAVCERSLHRLAARAGEIGSRVWIDMEEAPYVDATLELFRRVRAEHEAVGICLQTYLRRTPADVEALLPLGPAIRLVKGAYAEPAEVAYPRKADTDRAFLALAERLLERAGEGGALPVFGTHDLGLVGRIRERAGALGLSREAWEVHMLYGIRAAEQRALTGSGVTVRVLVSYGANWFPWYMRRLAERPANLWFVARSLLPAP
ncbi:MAG TPA: proline dehydrogenase family protein [Longimicrobiaceae bacterium]|nr:proline dehydrogenase family protein [Longimicrobiaceae bacterium]